MHTHATAEPEQLLRFVRPSHSGGPEHHVIVRSLDLRPLSCCCAAGRHGRLCWAAIDVTATELVPLAQQRWASACGMDAISAAARVLAQVRRWRNAARELAALRSCDYRLTDSALAHLRQA